MNPASRRRDGGARIDNRSAVGLFHPSPFFAPNQGLSARLHGSDRCEALGITVRDYAPLMAPCRSLVEAGINSRIRFDVFRGRTFSLRVRSIREAARLTVKPGLNGRPRFITAISAAAALARRKEMAATTLARAA